MDTANEFFTVLNLRRFFYFALVGALGAMLNTLVFFGLTTVGLHYLAAAAVATEAAIISNFIGNSIFTFSDRSEISLRKRFASFQIISVTTLAGTLLILWLLTARFGQEHLLLWNLFAIFAMFVVNFVLNYFFTWEYGEQKAESNAEARKKEKAKKRGVERKNKGSFFRRLFRLNALSAGAILFLISATSAYADDMIAVSQMGYHPNSEKQVILYTGSLSGTYHIVDAKTDQVVSSWVFEKAKDLDNNNVECQGNHPCIVGDFSEFSQEGTFYIQSGTLKTKDFVINEDVFKDNVDLFFEFFEAQKQQGSDYHADMHSGYSVPLKFIADGSFIIEADQAALALIRLGSAYRRNPNFFQGTDLKQTIDSYVAYLQGLQGVEVTPGDGPQAVRTGNAMQISAFMPGPVPAGMETIDVYAPGNTPTLVQAGTPVTSLCGADDGSFAWDECIAKAALYYKCQADEPCLQLSYIGSKGTPVSGVSGYGVSKGWGYEFGCYFDVDVQNGNFNNAPNPCIIFYEEDSRKYTAMTLLAFLEAYPAASNKQALLDRAIATYNYIKTNYASISSSDVDAGYFGAALFLLYDYTSGPQKQAYLEEAVSFSGMSKVFTADATKGNEFYWEEYVRHKNQIIAAGLNYPTGTLAPEEAFRGQMYQDYKDEGIAMSKNAERVFELYRNTNFQNSRQMLTMGLLASKTLELHPSPEFWIKTIADNQIAWLTGMNSVQKGTSISSPMGSVSFIFGIGDYPSEFHSRYLVNSEYRQESGGEFVGVRGTNYVFKEPGTENQIFFDGYTTILDNKLGARGNKWHGEDNIDDSELYQLGTPFKNGLKYIPGWINGAFDTNSDTDVFFNYNDNLDAYEYTETTNEIVATAVEYFAYLDGQLNNRPRWDGTIIPINTTPENTTATLTIQASPNSADVFLNGGLLGTTDAALGAFTSTIPSGTHILWINKTGFVSYTETFTVAGAGTKAVTGVVLSPQQTSNPSSNLSVISTPGEVSILLDSALIGTTDAAGSLIVTSLAPGTYTLTAQKTGYVTNSQAITLTDGQTTSAAVTMTQQTSTGGSIIASGTTHSGVLREDKNATFFVRSNAPNAITWLVDGVQMLATTEENSTFTWKPGILYIPRAPDYSNIMTSTIKAVSANESRQWDVSVENVVNPFFGGVDGGADVVGSDSTRVHVFTNDAPGVYSNVDVTIRSTEGGSNVLTVYKLEKAFNGNGETDWAKTLTNVPYGNSYISRITVYNNETGATSSYDLGDERAHYRQVPFSTSGGGNRDDDSPRRSNTGSGGGARTAGRPSLVYAVFEQDVLAKNATQTITLDAKNFNGGVHKVTATILTPKGNSFAVELALSGGTSEYGTWKAEFGNFKEAGLHQLAMVSIGATAQSMANVSVSDRQFYVVDEFVNPNEKLMIVYTTLSHSTASNGTNVTLTMDTRDALGIEKVFAKIKNTKNQEFTIALKRIAGSKSYGTWQGTFAVTQPDTTYTVQSITLENKETSKTYQTKDRSVYVQWLPPSETGTQADIVRPFSREHIKKLLKEPLVPTFVGFGLMLLVMGAMMIARGKRIEKSKAFDER